MPGGFPLTTPLKPDHEKRPFRFKLEGPFLRVSTMLLITPISPNFKGLKCSVFGRFRALQSRNIYGTIEKTNANQGIKRNFTYGNFANSGSCIAAISCYRDAACINTGMDSKQERAGKHQENI